MNIPKKISPDRIIASIVEVRYLSKIPYEIAIGIFFNALDETFTYTNRPLDKQQLTNTLHPSLLNMLPVQIGNRALFYNDKIVIELQPNSIIFNCLKEYISWDIYKTEIEKVLSQLSKAEIIDSYVRVGVRYISEYPNIAIQDCVKFSFSFGMPEIVSNTYTFHSEFKNEGFSILLNLNNNLPVISSKSSSGESVVTQISNIDIDVIMDHLSILTYNELLECIEKTHLREKVIFFNLLNENFLKTLNPIY